MCDDEKQREHVLANLENLVVKPTNESGGYGILIGPRSDAQQRQQTAEAVMKNPREWIAQPMLSLSTVPTIIDGKMQPRHVDLRPFVLSGKTTYVMPGGLTRVALEEGSMVVNSSQGGGSKDTWVVARTSSQKQSIVRDVVHDSTQPPHFDDHGQQQAQSQCSVEGGEAC